MGYLQKTVGTTPIVFFYERTRTEEYVIDATTGRAGSACPMIQARAEALGYKGEVYGRQQI